MPKPHHFEFVWTDEAAQFFLEAQPVREGAGENGCGLVGIGHRSGVSSCAASRAR